MLITHKELKKINTFLRPHLCNVGDIDISIDQVQGLYYDSYKRNLLKICNPKFKNLEQAHKFNKTSSFNLQADTIKTLSAKTYDKTIFKHVTSECVVSGVTTIEKNYKLSSMRFLPRGINEFKLANQEFDSAYQEARSFFGYARTSPATGYAPKLDKVKLQKESETLFCPIEVVEPLAIVRPPWEVTEGAHTYRFVTMTSTATHTPTVVELARDDDPIYNYLDQGFFYLRVNAQVKDKLSTYRVVSDRLDVNTMHIFIMCSMQPKLTEVLRDSCFVHSSDAQLTRLKMEKKLDAKFKGKYEIFREYIEKDYLANTSALAIHNLVAGVVEKVAIDEVVLTPTKASYQNISIEAPKLIGTLSTAVNFAGEFDIYTLITAYANHIDKTQEDARIVGEEIYLPVFSINGIAINIQVGNTGVRRINGIRINKVEVREAVYRASCSHSVEDYNLFLRRISKMSLRWHDVLANGVPVKMHSSMSGEDYNKPKPPADAPSVRLIVSPILKRFALDIEGRHIPVKLGKFLERVDTINRRTNCKQGRGYGATHRNYMWAQREVATALIECTTFEKLEVAEDGTKTKTSTVGVTRKDIEALLKKCNEAKLKALQKSKEFMETAITSTKAERIEFLGKPALKVVGSLRTYAIVLENAKVYDLDTKKYRCIVNDHHYQGVGYDDIAARLYALRNDAISQKHIGTLKGEAQPQAENAHAGQLPDRDENPDNQLTEELLASLQIE